MSGVLLLAFLWQADSLLVCPVLVAVSTDVQEVGAVLVATPGVGTGACLVAGARFPFDLHHIDCLADGLLGSPRNLSCRASSLARGAVRLGWSCG